MAIADLGRIFRLAVPNKTAATTSPPKNGIKSNADCCVMQCLYSHQDPRADLRPSKKMAAATRRARQHALEQCQHELGAPGAQSAGTRVPWRHMLSTLLTLI